MLGLVFKTNEQGDELLRSRQDEPMSSRWVINRNSGETIQLNAFHYRYKYSIVSNFILTILTASVIIGVLYLIGVV